MNYKYIIGLIAIVALLSVCLDFSAYDFNYFPPCDSNAPNHMEETIGDNDNAVLVGNAASQTGWTNVHVDNNYWTNAHVSGDCEQ